MSARERWLFPITLLLTAVVATPVPAQLVGPNPGVIFVSPLGEQRAPSPVVSSKQRAAARESAARRAKLEPIRKDVEGARGIADAAESEKATSRRIAGLESARRRAAVASRRLDALRKRFDADVGFSRAADDLAFALRKDLSRYRRALTAAREAGRAAARARAVAPAEEK